VAKKTKRRSFGSPIEIMLRNGIVQAAARERITLFDHSVFAGSPRLERVAHGHWAVEDQPDCEEWGDGDDLWSLFGGVSVESYRLDLLLETPNGLVAIECDGHEWHDRTKQQAAYDRSRDRTLLAADIPTIRFTGSEIHHSIERCVADVFAVARATEKVHSATIDAWDSGYRAGADKAQRNLHGLVLLLYLANFAGDDRFGGQGQSRGLLAGVV
jgi:hypothetical protein